MNLEVVPVHSTKL